MRISGKENNSRNNRGRAALERRVKRQKDRASAPVGYGSSQFDIVLS
jgi:hypothetical protein